jgi:NTE family protein
VGLVLGAGGPVGEAFHAGTLAALAEGGWDAREAAIVVGTSTGAVTGALLRGGMAPQDLFARVTDEPMSSAGRRILAAGGGWPHFARRPRQPATRRPASPALFPALAPHPWRTRPGLLLAGLLPPGEVSAEPIAAGFDRLFGGRWPDRPLWVCATDLDTGERVVLREGDIGAAVAASSAVPSFFAPVVVGGRRLVDGGAHSPVNADVVAEGLPDLDCVVVSAPMSIGAAPGRAGVDLPGRVLNHLFARAELRAVRRARVPVLIFEPTARELALMHYDAFDLSHRPAIARRARQTARARTPLTTTLPAGVPR